MNQIRWPRPTAVCEIKIFDNNDMLSHRMSFFLNVIWPCHHQFFSTAVRGYALATQIDTHLFTSGLSLVLAGTMLFYVQKAFS